jgi:hypothetical protein
MNESPTPSLAPPGAGLPAIELFIARRLFALKRKLRTREDFTATFEREREAVAGWVSRCPVEKRGERVLVPRLRGLEDSSRFWSVWMTLDHLRITNLVFARVIQSLADGRVPPGRASTADVKPDPGVTAQVEADYEASCDGLLQTVAGIRDLRSAAQFAHPWFGPLDAAGWHALAALHMGIHRAQLGRILSSLAP